MKFDRSSGQADVTNSRPLGNREFIALIAGLMALNAVAIDIMLPALPMIGDALLLTEENQRQHVLTAYILGFGGAQLLFGPLSDRYGRKGPLLVGMSIYILAALAGALATEFWFMLAARFVQGIGAAATRVLSVSIVRDQFGGRRMAEIMSIVMMVFMIAPVVAPAAGQLVVSFADWPMIYVMMAVTCGVFFLWTWIRLPETLPAEERTPLTPRGVTTAFRFILTNRTALFYGLANMAMFGALFGFITLAQQIFVGIYNLGAMFPLIFALIAVTMALASVLNGHFVGRFGMRRLSHGALCCYILTSLLWLTASLIYDTLPLVLFLAFFATCNFLFGWIGANFNAISMEPLGKVAGTGSAVIGFLQTAGGGIIGASIGQSFNGVATPMVAGFLVVSTGALALVLIAERGRLFGVGEGRA